MSESDEDEGITVDTFLGTPLDPVATGASETTDRRRARPVPIHEQRVLDERGRPLRFHGAFTGGFSAGHFNTVADDEGFTPGTFISRRRRKADEDQNAIGRKRQRPEDFMDAEDFGEFGIAPRTLRTGADYEDTTDKSTVDVMRDIIFPIRPIRLPIAVKLMRKFGWKEGQGVGAMRKVTGDGDVAARDDAEDEENLFVAPVDVPSISFITKNNTFGIGYSGIDPRTALFQAPAQSNTFQQNIGIGGSRRGIRGQAFGVSVLEEDDDDIYGADNMANYDWSIGGPSNEEDLHGWTAPTKKKDKEKKPLGYVGKVLAGFRLAATSEIGANNIFPRPFLPAWFVPVRGANAGLLRPPTDPTAQPLAEGEGIETPSIFDFISREDRLRLERARQKTVEPIGTGVEKQSSSGTAEAGSTGVLLQDVRAPSVKREPRKSRFSRWDSKPGFGPAPDEAPAPTTRQEPTPAGMSSQKKEEPASSQGDTDRPSGRLHFRPFARDVEKQSRYDEFVRLSNSFSGSEAYARVVPPHFTEWERQREQDEFTQAARLAKPLSGMLASRFHKGEEISLSADLHSVKTIPLPDAPFAASERKETKSETKTLSERDKAVQEKNYGPLTRRTLVWHPHKILCRRFNVPEPYPDSDIVGLEQKARQKRDNFSVFDFLNMAARSNPPIQKEASVSGSQPMELVPRRGQSTIDKKKSVFSVLLEDEEPSPTPTSSAPAVVPVADASAEQGPAQATAENSELSQPRADENNIENVEAPVTQNSENLGGSQEIKQEAAEENEEENGRISMDIFKAIFADSESSDDEENEKEEDKQGSEGVPSETRGAEPSKASGPQTAEEQPAPSTSKMMAASDLFRHLFEDPKEREEPSKLSQPPKSTTPDANLPSTSPKDASRDVYGPELPPQLPSSSAQTLTPNEFLLRMAAGEFSKKRKEKDGKSKSKKHKTKKSSKAKKSKKKKKKHKHASPSDASSQSS